MRPAQPTLGGDAPFGAEHYLPARITLPALRKAASGCRGCELFRNGTRTVFGQGPANASLLLVGEQPGHQEELAGAPFVGPAGRMLERALEQAAIPRSEVFVTNAVKHFRFEQRGKRRIHKKPGLVHVRACTPWLQAEIEAVEPRIVVTLGATAGQALLGAAFRVTQQRGRLLTGPEWAPRVVATIHPSALLRIPDRAAARKELAAFVHDLAEARRLAALE